MDMDYGIGSWNVRGVFGFLFCFSGSGLGPLCTWEEEKGGESLGISEWGPANFFFLFSPCNLWIGWILDSVGTPRNAAGNAESLVFNPGNTISTQLWYRFWDDLRPLSLCYGLLVCATGAMQYIHICMWSECIPTLFKKLHANMNEM